MDLKHRAIQVWGYLALISGCGCVIMQVFVLTLPRHLDLRIFVLSIVLAAYLIYIGVRAILFARHQPEAQFEWGRMFLSLVKLPGSIGRPNLFPGGTSTVPLVSVGT